MIPVPSGFDSVLASLIEADERAGGQPVDITVWTTRYPQYADQIRSYFADRGKLEALLGPRGATEGEAPTLAMSDQPAAGHVVRYFGDYELMDEIARGGMGVVFKARQASLNRVVAVKMILAGNLAGPSDVQRFHAEAEAAANLDHPNIVPIYEVGENEGQHYFSMKLIEGCNLSQAMKNRPSGETTAQQQQWAASLVVQIAQGVHHAHQRGILHRDLKPGNILLDVTGTPHVTDYGLAKKVKGGSDLTHTGAIVGTPSYMAPEQARSERGLSATVDVYSLGAILYELLTGRPPFQGASPLDTIMEVLEKEPVSPRVLNPKVSPELEAICLKCLEKQPIKRYSTALELADDLSLFLGGEPVKARPPSLSSLLGVWYGQHWKRSGKAFLMALLLCLPGVLGLCLSMEYVLNLSAERQIVNPSLTFSALGFSGKWDSPYSGLIQLFAKLLGIFWIGAVGGMVAAILKPRSRMETMSIGFACGCAILLAVLSIMVIPQFLHHISDRAGSLTRNILQLSQQDIEPTPQGTMQFSAKALKRYPELLNKPYRAQLNDYLDTNKRFVSTQVEHEARFFVVEMISVILLCLGGGIASAYMPSYFRDSRALKGKNSWLSMAAFDYWMYLMLIAPIMLFVVTIDLAMITLNLLSGYMLPMFYSLFGVMLLGLVVMLEYTLRQTSRWQNRQLSPWPLAVVTLLLLLVILLDGFFQWNLQWTIIVASLFLVLVGTHYFIWRWYQDRMTHLMRSHRV